MGDWVDEKAKDIILECYRYHGGRMDWLEKAFADALRQAEARARTRENEKCRELIGKRVDATQ